MTDAELIDAIVDAFGSEQRLADAIPPASRRIILRWANGSHPVQPAAWANIARALRRRIAELSELEAAVATRAAAVDDAGLPAATDYARDRT